MIIKFHKQIMIKNVKNVTSKKNIVLDVLFTNHFSNKNFIIETPFNLLLDFNYYVILIL